MEWEWIWQMNSDLWSSQVTRLFLSTMTTQSSLFLLLFTGLWAAQRSSPSSSPLCSQVHSPSLPNTIFNQILSSTLWKLPRSVSPMYQKPTPVKLPSKSASSARKSICLKRFRSFRCYIMHFNQNLTDWRLVLPGSLPVVHRLVGPPPR